MTFASVYIKREKTGIVKVNNVQATAIQGHVQQSFNGAGLSIPNFNLKEFSQNITALASNSTTQKFAVGGLSQIISGQPITNQSMLNGIFNGFAPAMGATAIQSGYNGVAEMKAALEAGTVNPTNFMQGFSTALNAVKNSMVETIDYSQYGDEITIDMVVELEHQNIAETPDRRVQSGQTYNEYYHILPKTLSFAGKIQDGGKYTASDYKELFEKVMESKKPFTFRAGEEIYENYMFTSFVPSRNFEKSLDFRAEIKKITPGDITLEKVNIPKSASKTKRTTKKNTSSKVGNAAKKVGNATAPKKIYGIGRIIDIDQGVDNLVEELNSWK